MWTEIKINAKHTPAKLCYLAHEITSVMGTAGGGGRGDTRKGSEKKSGLTHHFLNLHLEFYKWQVHFPSFEDPPLFSIKSTTTYYYPFRQYALLQGLAQELVSKNRQGNIFFLSVQSVNIHSCAFSLCEASIVVVSLVWPQQCQLGGDSGYHWSVVSNGNVLQSCFDLIGSFGVSSKGREHARGGRGRKVTFADI